MPECPTLCGGPGAALETLPDAAQEIRERYGCDRKCDTPHIAIRCPRCSGVGGAGCDYEGCKDDDAPVGMIAQYRCPNSQVNANIAEGFRHWDWHNSRNMPPVPGGLLDQAAGFVDLVETIDSEQGKCRAEIAEVERQKRMKK